MAMIIAQRVLTNERDQLAYFETDSVHVIGSEQAHLAYSILAAVLGFSSQHFHGYGGNEDVEISPMKADRANDLLRTD